MVGRINGHAGLLAALVLGCFLGLHAGACGAETVLDSTAAVVNNDIILTSELDREQRRILAAQPKLDPVTARRAALENLIAGSLVLQAAKMQGAELTDMQVDQMVQQMAARNHTTPEAVLNGVAPGRGEAAQREAFKTQYLMREFRSSRIRARLHASDAEVDALAANLKKVGTVEPRYHLAQVVVPLSMNPTEAEYNRAQADARKVVAALKAGEDPLALVAQYSRGYDSSQSGDLGFMPESQVPLPFVPALVKSRPGDVVGPFRSPVGMHVLKVIDISNDVITPIKTYDAAHILISPSIVVSDEAAQQRLLQIRHDILAGSISFAEAAKKYSEDTASAVKGGNLGYASPDRYDPAFAAGMVALKPGTISEPVKSSFGWHLILLKDVKVDSNSDSAYKDRARALILERKFREESAVFDQELRDSAYIHVLDPQLLEFSAEIEQSGKKH